MPQKPTHNTHIHTHAIAHKPMRRQQIHHNIVVITRIKRNILHPPRSHNPANHIQRLIPIKRRDLNPHHRLNLCKTPPKIKRQHTPAHSRLQIKTHHRNHIGHRTAVCNHRIDIRIGKRPQTHQPDLIPTITRNLCLCHRLPRIAHNTRHADKISRRIGIHHTRCQLQNGPIQIPFGIADFKLRGMHSHGQSPCTGSDIIARQRLLTPRIQLPFRGQSQRMCGNHLPFF